MIGIVLQDVVLHIYFMYSHSVERFSPVFPRLTDSDLVSVRCNKNWSDATNTKVGQLSIGQFRSDRVGQMIKVDHKSSGITIRSN